MISYKNTDRFLNPPKSLTGSLAEKKITEIIRLAPNHKVDGYNSPDVKERLRHYFQDKCAYCESVPIASASFRIDHYRPKNGIRKLIGSLRHDGYYWLALEWTNLIQACELCNAIKSNQFPVEHDQVNALNKEPHITDAPYRNILGDVLQTEKRLLLHPELDDVENYLVFNPDGSVSPQGDFAKGRESIRVYGLNRKDLVLQRKKRIDIFFRELVYIFTKYENRGLGSLAYEVLLNDMYDFFRRLLEEQLPQMEYSRLGFFMFHRFEDFFIARFKDMEDHQELLRRLYRKALGGWR